MFVQEVTVLQLVDSLKAAGQTARQPTVREFLEQHPGLEAEIREASSAGFTWPQIAKQLERDYGWRISNTSLRNNLAAS